MQESRWSSFIDWIKISGFVFFICGFWIFLPPLIMGTTLYLLYVKLFAFVPCVLLYLVWYYYSRDWPESGCMPSERFRTSAFYIRWGCDYFNYRLVKTVELPPDRNYIIGTRVESVIGGPIRVEKNPNPTDEEVDRLHAAYCEKLIELFETHKANYGIRPEQKIILY